MIGGFFATWAVRAYIRVGNTLVDPKQMDPNLVKAVVSLAGLVVGVWLMVTSRQMAQLLGLRGWLNPYSVAKESAAYFEDQGIRSNFFGPYLSAIFRPGSQSDDDQDAT